MSRKAISVHIPLFPAFPLLSVFPCWSSRPVFGLQGLTGSTTKHVSLPVGTFWRTSWKPDGSPILSGQSPDGKHTDLQKAVHDVSQLQQARRASCCLILIPDSICTLSFYIYSLHVIPILLPLRAFLLLLRPFLQLILYNNLVFFPMFKAVWDDFFSLSQVLIPMENSWHKHSLVVYELAAPQVFETYLQECKFLLILKHPHSD